MAQNITIAGSSYNNVPMVNFPRQGGGVASFVDPEDLTELDLAAGQYLTVTGNTTDTALYATAIDSTSGVTSTKKIMEDGYWSEGISSDKTKEWDITLTSDVSSASVSVIIADPWLIANYNNSNLLITMYAKFTVTSNSSSYYTAVTTRGNRVLGTYGSFSSYGTVEGINKTGATRNACTAGVTGGTIYGSFAVNSAGNLRISGSTSGIRFKAGAYHIVATIS